MTLAELEDLFRVITRDTVEPYLWCRDVIRHRIHEAENEACLRKRLIRDTLSYVCKSSVLADSEYVNVSGKIIAINKVSVLSGDSFLNYARVIDATTADQLGDWRNFSPGIPNHVLYYGDKLRVIPVASSQLAIKLDVYRYPLSDSYNDELELPEKHHVHLLDYAIGESYLDNDSDAQDIQRGQYYMEKFERIYGPPVKADSVKKSAISVPQVNKRWY